MIWQIAVYRPAALFSLKIGIATATAAKSLFLPTPFAIRTALLDAAIRTEGLHRAVSAFEILKGLKIAARPPEAVSVTNLFAKVQKPRRTDKPKGKKEEELEEEATASASAMIKSIAFREYVHLSGDLALAFSGKEEALAQLRLWLPQVNYFGKRGSFFQLIEMPLATNELNGFYALEGMTMQGNQILSPVTGTFPMGIIQLMDDWGESMTFEHLNIYSDEKIRVGAERVRNGVILPYRLTRSSKSFSLYERVT